MKKILLSGLLISLASFLYCQISIVRSDVFDLGDEFPRIYYAFEMEGDSYHIDSAINEQLVFDDLDFPHVEIDTLEYMSPSETDTEGLYEDATCSFMTRDGFIMHMLITDESMKLIGFQGQLPMTGDPMNLIFVDTLIMGYFPSEFEDTHQDIGSAFENQHISVFESIIPSEYYSTVTALYDTVRFLMNLKIIADHDEFGSLQCVGDSNLNGTFQYLRENRQLINVFDIQLRSKFSGSYTSLSDVPGIGDQLPMDLPIYDTTTSYSYWTKDNINPLVEIEMNTNRDSVYNVTYRYAYLSNTPGFEVLTHQVFPNPTTNYIEVYIPDFENQIFEIYSIDGKKIKDFVLFSQSSKINLEDLPAGNYIYKITNESKQAVAGGKFVKQ